MRMFSVRLCIATMVLSMWYTEGETQSSSLLNGQGALQRMRSWHLQAIHGTWKQISSLICSGRGQLHAHFLHNAVSRV